MEKVKTQEASPVLFHTEDSPFYKLAHVLPYFLSPLDNTLTLYLRCPSSIHPQTFHSSIRESEPSILFTIARLLIEQSHSFFPNEDYEEVQKRGSAAAAGGIPLFYYNPMV